MNINNNASNVKRELLVRIARLQLEGELDSRKINKIPTEMRPANSQPIGCCIYHDRELLKMRLLARMGISVENYNFFDFKTRKFFFGQNINLVLILLEPYSKKLYDKRETAARKDAARNIERAIKNR